MLSVAVLGPLEVRRDGELLAVPSGKSTELLVRLALSAGSTVGTDQLLAELWADAASGAARNTLQSKVSALRRALRQADLVVGAQGGYRLAATPDQVDALRVADICATAHQLRRSGNPAAALETATQGLGLFRGVPFADAGDGAWLHPHRARLDHLRVGLLEDQFAAQVQLGLGADAVGPLEELVGRYPLRETLWYWLITALYRSGRQADALAAYARVRGILVDELGLEPGPQLQELEKQVLRHDLDHPDSAAPAVTEQVTGTPQPEPVAVAEAPSPQSQSHPQPVTGNLPRLSSSLIGRQSELLALSDRVRDERLVTLVGTPGVGKTRLVIEVARRSEAAGGVWLVRLDDIDAFSSISQAVAETLNLSSEAVLLERVASAETMLVFDNCEHVIDGAAEFISQLLDAGPGLRVLATSQLPLGVDGETVFQLEPLSEADSVALFTTRAARTRPELLIDDGATDLVAQLCRSLDGLPLAIELAAARMKSLSVQEISRRLQNRFDILRDPTSRRPERRRALSAAIGWSYDLLFPDDQKGLWALSTFAGGAPLAAAERVLAALGVPADAAVDVIGRLADRSLVQVDVADSGTVRYRLLDSIRAFALARLQEGDRADTAFEAHADWYGENADRCRATVRGPAQGQCLQFVRDERANIDAALTWSAEHRPLLGVRIVNGFGWTWVVLGDGVAGANRVRTAVTAAGPAVTGPDRASALLLAGWLEASAGNLDTAEGDLDQAVAAAEGTGQALLLADVDRHRAFLRLQQGRPGEAQLLAETGIVKDRAANRRWEEATGLVLAAYAFLMSGDMAGASRSAAAAMTVLEPIGDPWGSVHGEAMLGALAQAHQQFAAAADHLHRAAESSGLLGFPGQEALHLTRLGRVHQQSGNSRLAADTLDRAIAAAQSDGDLRVLATARIHLARVLRGTDLHQEAVALLEQANQWYRRSGSGDGALLAAVLLAAVAPSGSSDTRETMEALLAQARQVNDGEVEILALDVLARLAAEAGAVERARQLLGLADSRNDELSGRVDVIDRFDARRAHDLIRASDLITAPTTTTTTTTTMTAGA